MNKIQTTRGEAPDAGELLVAALGIAGLTQTLQERTAAQQDEVQRVLEQVCSMTSAIEVQGRRLEAMYAPNAVRAAAMGAQSALVDFSREAAGSANRLRQQLDSATRPLSLRIAGVAAVPLASTLLGLLCVAGFAMHFVPSVDEVKARRAALAKQPIQAITYEGRQWVPISDRQTLCEHNNLKQCAEYGRVQ